MVRELMKDTVFLAQKAQPATADDIPTADDLLDTLRAHADGCVGMAANMIGVNKAIIVFDDEGTLREMFNPEIVYRKGLYLTEEGCLSLSGTRPIERAEEVEVTWTDMDSRKKRKRFRGLTAEAIQHEMDHFDGILI